MDPISNALDAELIEAHAWRDLFRAASPEMITSCGIEMPLSEGVVMTMATRMNVPAMNRVIGVGVEQAATEELIDTIVRQFQKGFEHRDAARLTIKLSPFATPSHVGAWLAARGFVLKSNWLRLVRTVPLQGTMNTAGEQLPDASLTLRKIDSTEAFAFAKIIIDVFSWPEETIPWVAAAVGRAGWHHYLVYEKHIPVATAGMFVEGKRAWFGMAGTMPDARRRGAQSALIARRIKDAQTLGCTLLSVETSEDTAEKPNSSTRNLKQFGFGVAYERENWVLEGGGR